MKALSFLLKMEKEKLSELSNQKQNILDKKNSLKIQLQQLNETMISNNTRIHLNSLIWQNQLVFQEKLMTIKNTLEKHINLIDDELNRISVIWEQQLHKQQSLDFIIEEKHRENIEILRKKEQKTLDDLASRRKMYS